MLPTALRAARAPLRPARALSSRRWAPRAVAPPPESAALREKAAVGEATLAELGDEQVIS